MMKAPQKLCTNKDHFSENNKTRKYEENVEKSDFYYYLK